MTSDTLPRILDGLSLKQPEKQTINNPVVESVVTKQPEKPITIIQTTQVEKPNPKEKDTGENKLINLYQQGLISKDDFLKLMMEQDNSPVGYQ